MVQVAKDAEFYKLEFTLADLPQIIGRIMLLNLPDSLHSFLSKNHCQFEVESLDKSISSSVQKSSQLAPNEEEKKMARPALSHSDTKPMDNLLKVPSQPRGISPMVMASRNLESSIISEESS